MDQESRVKLLMLIGELMLEGGTTEEKVDRLKAEASELGLRMLEEFARGFKGTKDEVVDPYSYSGE